MDSPSVDRSDMIVGSWRLPQPLRRVPRVVWALAAATLADAALRAVSIGGLRPLVTPPVESVLTVLSLVPSAAALFFPAAVVLGRWSGQTGRLLIRGTVLLAVAELLSLAVIVVMFGPLGGEPDSALDIPMRGRSVELVQLARSLLALAGAGFIAFAWRPPRSRSVGLGTRAVVILVVATAVVELVAQVVGIAYPLALIAQSGATDEFESAFIGPFITPVGVATQSLAIVTSLLWATIACFAVLRLGSGSRPRRRWALLSVGASSTVLAGALAALPLAIAYVAGSAFMTNGLWLIQLYSTLMLVGVACFIAGLATPRLPYEVEAAGEQAPQPAPG